MAGGRCGPGWGLTVKAAALVVVLAGRHHVKRLWFIALGHPRRVVVAVANTDCFVVRVPPRRVRIVLNQLELRKRGARSQR